MDSTCSNHSPSPPHVVLFPFMAKGHTIPLLHFTHFLLHRNISVTVFTTPANHPFIAQFLVNTNVSIIDLHFPCSNVTGIPIGIESTDKLPSMSLFFKFVNATKHMQTHFEQALQSLPPISFMVSDGFLWWTLDSSSKLGIPRLAFYGISTHSMAVSGEVMSGLMKGLVVEDEDKFLTVAPFPWIRVTKSDLNPHLFDPNPEVQELFEKVFSATARSYGLLMNSFYELESAFVDYWNSEASPKTWCVGPLCLEKSTRAHHPQAKEDKPTWVQWLDQKLEQGKPVMYVAFGTQAEILPEQLKEIAIGLEESKVSFLWVIRKNEWELPHGFTDRVKERGIIVREWVDQWEILIHSSVQGFLSHCGWNSVLESVSAGVPILAWAMLAEQYLNARLVVEEVKMGLRVETCDGSVRGFVTWVGLTKMAKELMEGQKGKEVRMRVKELAGMAKKAVEEGGSSWRTLNLLMGDTCGKDILV